MPAHSLGDALWSFTRELSSRKEPWLLPEEFVDLYGELEANSFRKQYGVHAVEPPRLRLSSISKPLLYQLMPLWGYGRLPEDAHDMVTTEIFHYGDSFENRVFILMGAFFGCTHIRRHYTGTGSNVIHLHNDDGTIDIARDVEVTFGGVVGHIDIYLNYYDEVAPLEVKTVAGYYADKFYKFLPDDRGYISQLATYMQATLLTTGYFIMKDKESHFVHLVPLDSEWVEPIFERNLDVIPLLHKYATEGMEAYFSMPNEDLEVIEYWDGGIIPPPEEASVKKGTVNFLVIPESLKYMPNIGCIYDLGSQEGSVRKAVKDVKTASQIMECLGGLNYGTSG